jgi:hypothetical protein
VKKIGQVGLFAAVSVVCIIITSIVLIILSVDYRVPDQILMSVWWIHTIAQIGNILVKFSRKLGTKLIIHGLILGVTLLVCYLLTFVYPFVTG